jgi:type I restriction enzyme S subunit
VTSILEFGLSATDIDATHVPLGEIITGAKVFKAGNGDYPLLSMTMHHGLVRQEDKFKKRVASRDLSQYKVVSNGQLVVGFPIDEGVLSFQMLVDAGIVSPAYGVWDLRNPDGVDRSYLEKYLRSPQALSYYTAKLRGSTARRRSLPREVFLGMPIPLPPVDEQRRIAAILDKADELRTKRRQALARLDVLTQSIFQAMFHTGSNPHMVLGDCLSFVTSGGRGWAKYYSNSGSRFIRSLDVQSNYIGRESEAFVVPPENAEAKRTRLKQNDVLLTITGSLIGRAAAITPDHIGAYVSQHVAILRPDTNLLSPIFLSHFLNLQNGGQQLIRAVQYGQTKPGLNFEQIRRFAVPQATLGDQKKFEDRVAAVELVKDRQRAQLSELKALFASLQHRAFRGEL